MIDLPKLPYSYKALEPAISSETVTVHYKRHHAGYMKKTNELLKGSPLEGKSLIDIVRFSRGDLFNNAAQVLNHDLYWWSLSPEKQKIPGILQDLIKIRFGSLGRFKEIYMEMGKVVFGSGWLWIIKDGIGIDFRTTRNADNPIRKGEIPLLTVDLWEHAYYLDYQNKREEYLKNLFDRLDWNAALSRYKRTFIRSLFSKVQRNGS